MTVHEIEQALAFAQQRFDVALKALAQKHNGGEWEEYWVASDNVLELERTLARAKGEQYADISDFPVQWDAGAPMPHVLANDYNTFLIFYLREVDPAWDGSTVKVVDPADERMQPLALVEFDHCVAFKMGTPSDEVFHGHPLSGKGLKGYTAQIVRNSEWIKELETINKVHIGYRAERWTSLTHYILWFHDSTFECVAESYTVETVQKSFADLLTHVCSRLLQ